MELLMACGGTGGHITNGINLASYLKEKDPSINIQFVITNNTTYKQILKNQGMTYYTITAKSTPSKFNLRSISFLIKLLQSFFKSVIILNKVDPQLIIGFGSYASAPVILANLFRFKKAKVIIHEQNIKPGKANLWLSGLACKVAVSFKETENYFRKNTVFTGNPLKRRLKDISRKQALNFLGLNGGKLNILVMGGSQGSNFINQLIIGIARDLDVHIKKEIQLIHLAGKRDYNYVSNQYEKINFKDVKVFDYLDGIEYAYAASDLVISRAGATTLAEIIALAKAAILIPYPYAGGHQKINANYLKKNEASIVFEQENLNPKVFKDTISDLILNKDRLAGLRINCKRLSRPEANERFTNLIFGVLKERK